MKPQPNCTNCALKAHCMQAAECPRLTAAFQKKEPLFARNSVADGLFQPGFARVTPMIPTELQDDAAEIVAAFSNLPFDLNDSTRTRRRKYQKYVYIPWTEQLLVRPVTYYQQAPGFNPQDGARRRHFEGLGALVSNPLLVRFAVDFFKSLPIGGDYLTAVWDIGIHFIRMEARFGVPAVASPNRLHKDGEPFTAIMLVHRENVIGGNTIIATDGNGENILDEFTLTEPFETAIVRDAAVWHHVTPVETAEGADKGTRDVVLIEYTPMKPDLSQLTGLVQSANGN